MGGGSGGSSSMSTRARVRRSPQRRREAFALAWSVRLNLILQMNLMIHEYNSECFNVSRI